MINNLIVKIKQSNSAKRTLLCFHFSGGSAHYFQRWKKLIPDSLNLYAVELPGRNLRQGDPFAVTHMEIIDALVECYNELSESGCPLLLFGHSMGAMLAFEYADALEKRLGVIPEHVYLSGKCPPFKSLKKVKEYEDMTDSELISQLVEFEGTSSEVLGSVELMEYLLPIFRADFTLSEKYLCESNKRVKSDITVFGGLQDKLVDVSILNGWEIHTTGNFSFNKFLGGHFFINNHEKEIISIIESGYEILC